MTFSEHITPILKGIPAKPGCYLMKDEAGVVIYIGKAVNLRNRVRSYFQASANHSRKTTEMVSHVVTSNGLWFVLNSRL